MNTGIPHVRRKPSPGRESRGCWQGNVLSSHLGKKYRERNEETEGLPRGDSAVMRETGSALGSQSHLCFSFFDQGMSK